MVVAVVGTAGSGKSYLLSRMVAVDPNRPRVVIGLLEDPSLMKFLRGREWKRRAVLAPIARIRLQANESVMLDLTPLTPEEALMSLEKVTAEVVRNGGGVIAIDEAHLFLTKPTPQITRYIRGARHYHLKVYIATQRWVDIHPHIRAVVKHLFIFRTVSGRDLQALQNEPGVSTIRLDRLKTGEYVYVRR